MEQEWLIALNSANLEERRKAIQALAKTRDRRALPVLQRVYENDPEPEIREYAREAAQHLYSFLKQTEEAALLQPIRREASSLLREPVQRSVPEPAGGGSAAVKTLDRVSGGVLPAADPAGETLHKHERRAKEALKNQLMEGETLLAFSGGAVVREVSSQQAYCGLTDQRLILLPVRWGKPTGKVHNFWREYLESIVWAPVWSRLKIQLPAGVISIRPNKRRWKKRAREIEREFDRLPQPAVDPSRRQEHRVDQIEVFRKWGLIASAQGISEEVRLPAPSRGETAGSAAEALRKKRLALRVGAGFLFINVLMGLMLIPLMIILGEVWNPVALISAAIDVTIGIHLWRGQARQWSTWAIIRAALGLLIFGGGYLLNGLYLDFLAQASFCGALILVLAGESDRTRTLAAAGIYLVGFLGVVLGNLLLGFFGALL